MAVIFMTEATFPSLIPRLSPRTNEKSKLGGAWERGIDNINSAIIAFSMVTIVHQELDISVRIICHNRVAKCHSESHW